MGAETTASADDGPDLDAQAAMMIAAMSAQEEFAPPTSPADIPLLASSPGADAERAFTGFGGDLHVRNVSAPTLTPFLPDPAIATGAAVLIAPGGGFRMLARQAEGTDVAEWLRARGIAAFVLTYRLKPTGPTRAEFATDLVRSLASAAREGSAEPTFPTEPDYRAQVVADVDAALSLIRARAADWWIDTNRIGAIGFSAGAYVLSWALADGSESVDALACIYGGRLAATDLPEKAPALFAAVAARDALCSSDVVALVDAWRSRGLSVEAHLYDSDAHGFGIARRGTTTDPWSDRYAEWLARTGFTDAASTKEEDR